jgi:hypothetical protein
VTDHHLADSILRAYLAERAHRRNPYPRCSSGFGSARHVSACHSAPTRESKRGEMLCDRCGQPCDLAWLEQRRTRQERVDPAAMVHVHETRQVDRDGEQRANVESVWRRVALERLVTRVPADLPRERWRFDLVAWALLLDYREQALDVGMRSFPLLRPWHPDRVSRGVEEARGVVTRRALRAPALTSEVLGERGAGVAVDLAREAYLGAERSVG